MYRPLIEEELIELGNTLTHYTLWVALKKFIQQFYPDSAYSFTVISDGEYDDQASITYHAEDLYVYDEEGKQLTYDVSKPAFSILFDDKDILEHHTLNQYDLYNHSYTDSADKDLILWGDLPPLREPVSTYNDRVGEQKYHFKMSKITDIDLYKKIED